MSVSEAQKTQPPVHCLADLKDGEQGMIRTNNDLKATEMGLFPGVHVVMFRNRKSEQSVVIGAGDARFFVSRAIAKKVEVEVTGSTSM